MIAPLVRGLSINDPPAIPRETMDAGGRGTPTSDDYIGYECSGHLIRTPTNCSGGALEIGAARYFAKASHGEAAAAWSNLGLKAKGK